jgi:hypothetical protein
MLMILYASASLIISPALAAVRAALPVLGNSEVMFSVAVAVALVTIAYTDRAIMLLIVICLKLN